LEDRTVPTQTTPFATLANGFTQALYGTYNGFLLMGVAFAPNGDPLVVASGGPLVRFSTSSTSVFLGSTIHNSSTLPNNAGIGLTNHPNGTLYSNTGGGVLNLDANTGAVLHGPYGPAGSGFGIAVDPQTGDLAYTGKDGNIDYVTSDFKSNGTFSTATTGQFTDQIAFDPTGNFLFLAQGSDLKILNSHGTLVQSIPTPGGSDGIAFHASSPKFVVTNNNNGTITRFDFAKDDYTQAPTVTPFASGGFRGDQAQVGPDGNLYLTQAGTVFANGTTFAGDPNSLVVIGPGFAAPPGVQPLKVTAPADQKSAEGTAPSFDLGSFSDGGPGPWDVDVNWGDGTPDTVVTGIKLPGTIPPQSHTYGEESQIKPYTATVKVTEETGNKLSDSAAFSVAVSDPAVKQQLPAVQGNAVACQPLSGVSVATFTDPGGAEPNKSDPTGGIASHYTVVSIDWGDKSALDTTTGAIAYSGAQGSPTDPFTVTGSHTYQTEGTFTITAIISHEGSKQTTLTNTVVVTDKLGLLLLDPTGSQSLMVTGNGDVAVNGDCGAVVVDSNDPTAAAFVVGHGVVAAGDFDVTGGVTTQGHGVVPSPADHEAPTPDPLAGLGLPSPLPPAPVGNTATVLNPGTYVGGLQLTGTSAVTMMPGVYVMEGGGFSVTGQASVTGSGVVIINAPGGPSDTISVSGQGVVSLLAPTSGTYQGVAVFQDPASSNPVSFTGQANVTIAGVVYAPAAPVSITGGAVVTITGGAGTATKPPIAAAMIAYDLQVSGDAAALTINADDPPAGGASTMAVVGGTGGAADVHSLALHALVSDGLSSPGTPSDPAAMDQVAMSLAGNADLFSGAITAAKKKTS
jgi:hypothetical protein